MSYLPEFLVPDAHVSPVAGGDKDRKGHKAIARGASVSKILPSRGQPLRENI
jgi:hypothetical protein